MPAKLVPGRQRGRLVEELGSEHHEHDPVEWVGGRSIPAQGAWIAGVDAP